MSADLPADESGRAGRPGRADSAGSAGSAGKAHGGLTPPAEVVRAALNRARAGAQDRGYRPGQPDRRRRRTEDVRSGASRDGRDPALVGDALERLAAERGWNAELSVGALVGRWHEVVGRTTAEHCVPETFEDGRLVVRTDSTAWATQVRLLEPQLLAALAREVGEDVVREVQVVGPGGSSWVRGTRRVRGRGPRDTYG